MATFTQTKLRGHQCTLIFTGSHYYLHSSFYGLLGQATRDYSREVSNPVHKAFFTLEVGNHHCSFPSSTIATAFKRAINKEENTYVTKMVEYEIQERDCANCNLKIEMV